MKELDKSGYQTDNVLPIHHWLKLSSERLSALPMKYSLKSLNSHKKSFVFILTERKHKIILYSNLTYGSTFELFNAKSFVAFLLKYFGVSLIDSIRTRVAHICVLKLSTMPPVEHCF